MKISALLAACACVAAVSACSSVATTRAKAPSYTATYAGEYRPFTTCVVNTLLERMVTTVIFDDPNRTSTVSSWISDPYGRHLVAGGTLVQKEAGKVQVEVRSQIDKTIWGTVPEPTKQFIAGLDACGKTVP
jgi:hypothetical protein